MATEQIVIMKERINKDEPILSYERHEYTPQTGANLNIEGEICISITWGW